jgi:hypothetical protein
VTALIEDVAGLLVPKPDRLPNTIETLAFCPRTRARKRPSQPCRRPLLVVLLAKI